MARPHGSRNTDYEEERLALARGVLAGVLADPAVQASLRQMAASAGTSVATLRHYFGDRVGVWQAMMEVVRIDAAPRLIQASIPLHGDVRQSVTGFLRRFVTAWSKYRVGVVVSSTLAVGLGQPQLGPMYVDFILEPLLQTAETLLRHHVDAGELRAENIRLAALQLLSPVVLALLHQDSLGGRASRPLDMDALVVEHVSAFFQVYRIRNKGRRNSAMSRG